MKTNRFIVSLIIFLLFPSLLLAEYRTFSSDLTRDAVMEEFFKNLDRSGIKIEIRKIYSEKRDGRTGILFWLYPKKNHCEILFFHGSGRRGSEIRIFTQTTAGMHRFHRYLTSMLKMKEVGAVRDSQTGGGGKWPAPR